MPPIPSRIEFRDSGNALIADAEASGDGLTLRAFDAQGGLLASLQVSTGGAGRVDIATGGIVTIGGDLELQGPSVRITDLPTTDPGAAGALYSDNGTVKVSAG